MLFFLICYCDLLLFQFFQTFVSLMQILKAYFHILESFCNSSHFPRTCAKISSFSSLNCKHILYGFTIYCFLQVAKLSINHWLLQRGQVFLAKKWLLMIWSCFHFYFLSSHMFSLWTLQTKCWYNFTFLFLLSHYNILYFNMYRQKVISWSSWALLYWLGFWSYLIVIQAQIQVSCTQSSFDSLVLSILKHYGWNLIDSIYFTYQLRLILFTSFQMLLLGTPKHFLFKQLDYLGSAFPISLGALSIFSFLLLCIHICDNNLVAISFHFQRQDWYGCSSFWCIENWSWISSFCYPRSNQFSCCCIQGMLGFTLLNYNFFSSCHRKILLPEVSLSACNS